MSGLVTTTPPMPPARSAVRAVMSEGLRLVAWSAYKRPKRVAAGTFGLTWTMSVLATTVLMRTRMVEAPVLDLAGGLLDYEA